MVEAMSVVATGGVFGISTIVGFGVTGMVGVILTVV